LPLLLVLTGWFIALSWTDANDHHTVRRSETSGVVAKSPTATQAFRDWLNAGPGSKSNSRYNVFIVAAEGGGIRAAVMTAMVLDELRAKDPEFVRHLFALVGVSGGSIGAATFAAAVRQDTPALHPAEAILRPGPGRPNWQAALHQDLLSPTLRSLLCLDLLSHLWPRAFGDLSSWDRARTFEDALAAYWKLATGHEIGNLGFDDLRPRAHTRDPALILMTTSVSRGEPVAISHVGELGISTLEDQAPMVRVPLLTAALMSARFPIITPPALLPTEGPPLRYVDGGYFENSGVTAALNLIQSIKAPELLKLVQYVVIHISNGAIAERASNKAKSSYFSEFVAPVSAAYLTGDAHEHLAIETLRRMTRQDPNAPCAVNGTCPIVKEIPLVLLPPNVPLPLGWYLSASARNEIARQLGDWSSLQSFAIVKAMTP